MKKRAIIVTTVAVLFAVCACIVPAVACNDHHPWQQHYKHQERYQPSLVFFYNATGGHLITNSSKANEARMLKVVQQLDHKYNVTYIDLGKYPGKTMMARMAYGVTKTPTISVIGPDFPAVASNFYNIQGVHSYNDCIRTIEHNKF